MAQINLNYGTTAGDGTGDILFDIFGDIQSNFNGVGFLDTTETASAKWTFSSGLTLSNGLDFGSTVAGAETTLTRHLALYGSSYGMSVTSSKLNIVSSSGSGTIKLHGTTVQATGAITATTSVASPIYYDSSGTTYYLDPSNTGTSLNIAGDAVIAGQSFADHKYHKFTAGNYYFDDYNQAKFLRLFWQNAGFDHFRFETPVDVQYWDFGGTNDWATWSGGDTIIKTYLDGNEVTGTAVDHTHRKFRFVLNRGSGWPTTALILFQLSWTGVSWATANPITITLETSSTQGGTYTTKDTFTVSTANGTTSWGSTIYAAGNLHDGNVWIRVTVEFTDWTDNASYTTIPLRNICCFSNYTGEQGSILPWYWNWDMNVTFRGGATFAGDVYAPKYYDSSGTTYYLDLANTGTSLNVAGDIVVGGEDVCFVDTGNKLTFSETFQKYTLYYSNGSTLATLSLGTVEAASAVYSAVYYDGAGTTYYLDLANTGTSLNVAGGINVAGSISQNGTAITLDADGTGTGAGINFGPDAYLTFNATGDVFSFEGASTSVVQAYEFIGYTSISAPVYYDSSGTTYYLDLANTGTSLNVAGKILAGGSGGVFIEPGTGTSKVGIAVDPSGETGQGYYLHNGFAFNYWKLTGTGTCTLNTGKGEFGSVNAGVYYDTSGTTYFLDLANTNISLNVAGNITASSFIRAGGVYLSDNYFGTEVGVITDNEDWIAILDGTTYYYGGGALTVSVSSPTYVGFAYSRMYYGAVTTTSATQTDVAVGSSGGLVIASNVSLAFTVQVVGRRTDVGGEQSAAYLITGLIVNDGGTTRMVGTPVVTVLGEDNSAWDCTVSADDTNDKLRVLVTGAASTTIAWRATVRATYSNG